jgi:hypothetical protein
VGEKEPQKKEIKNPLPEGMGIFCVKPWLPNRLKS